MRTLLLILLSAVFIVVSAHAQPASTPAPIAVLELTGENVSDAELRLLSDRLRIELFKTGAFDVIERQRTEEILAEQGLQQSGCMATECAVEIGQLIGVEQMVAGSVGRVGSVHTITARLIDVETGRIEAIAVRDCVCPLEQMLTQVMAEVAGDLAGKPVTPSTGEAQDVAEDVAGTSAAPVKRQTTDIREQSDDSIYLGTIGVGGRWMHPRGTHTATGTRLDWGYFRTADQKTISITTACAVGRLSLNPGNWPEYFLEAGLGVIWIHEDRDDRNLLLPILSPALGVNFTRRFGAIFQIGMPLVAFSLNF